MLKMSFLTLQVWKCSNSYHVFIMPDSYIILTLKDNAFNNTYQRWSPYVTKIRWRKALTVRKFDAVAALSCVCYTAVEKDVSGSLFFSIKTSGIFYLSHSCGRRFLVHIFQYSIRDFYLIGIRHFKTKLGPGNKSKLSKRPFSGLKSHQEHFFKNRGIPWHKGLYYERFIP